MAILLLHQCVIYPKAALEMTHVLLVSTTDEGETSKYGYLHTCLKALLFLYILMHHLWKFYTCLVLEEFVIDSRHPATSSSKTRIKPNKEKSDVCVYVCVFYYKLA